MKQYKIKLYSGAPALAGELAILAAKSNGGDTITLSELQGVFKAQKRLYPVSFEGSECEIIGDTILHLDCPVSGEKLNKTVLVIEEVEVFELEEVREFNGYGAMAD
jgi:hypothetical protein